MYSVCVSSMAPRELHFSSMNHCIAAHCLSSSTTLDRFTFSKSPMKFKALWFCYWWITVIILLQLGYHIYRLITASLLLRVNCDKIMHVRWDFDASCARTQRVSTLDKHQNWSERFRSCQHLRLYHSPCCNMTHSCFSYSTKNLVHTHSEV